MPPKERPDPHRRAREQTKMRSNPINGNTPQQTIMYPIASISTPTPNVFLPPEVLEDRNLRRINREARMKANMERRRDRLDIIVRPPIIPVIPTPTPVMPPPPPARPPPPAPAARPARPNRITSNRPGSRKFEITARANNNKNPSVVPLIPPLTNNKNYDFITPPIDNLKTDDSTTIESATVTKDNQNLYLIGGTALIAFLVVAMNKR